MHEINDNRDDDYNYQNVLMKRKMEIPIRKDFMAKPTSPEYKTRPKKKTLDDIVDGNMENSAE